MVDSLLLDDASSFDAILSEGKNAIIGFDGVI
jgi:hypothetical protein